MLLACQQVSEELPVTNMSGLPDEIGDSVRVTSMVEERIEYILDSKRYRRYIDEKMIEMDQVYLESYDEFGKLSSTMVCDSAKVDEVKNFMIARWNVEIHSENGILKTDYLEWNQSTDKIYAKGWVQLTRGKHILNGYEMHTDINLEHISMVDVEAKGKVEEGDLNWEE